MHYKSNPPPYNPRPILTSNGKPGSGYGTRNTSGQWSQRDKPRKDGSRAKGEGELDVMKEKRQQRCEGSRAKGEGELDVEKERR